MALIRSRLRWIVSYVGQALPLDMRALSLFRIGLGLASLVEVLELWQYRDAFLSRTGVCPEQAAKGPQAFDLFLAARNDTALDILLLLNIAATMLFACGFWTRSAAFTVWLFALSQYHRLGDCVGYGGDQLRCQLLFWAMLIPVGDVWSVDAYILHREDFYRGRDLEQTQADVRPRQQQQEALELHELNRVRQQEEQQDLPMEVRPQAEVLPVPKFRGKANRGLEMSAACDLGLSPTMEKGTEWLSHERSRFRAPFESLLILLQLAVMYAATAASKDGETWRSGQAVMMTLRMPQYAREPLARWLLLFPSLCTALTHSTLHLEAYGWSLALLPFAYTRAAALLAFGCLHAGMHMCLRVGHFQLFVLSGWLATTPPCILDKCQMLVPRGTWFVSPPRRHASGSGQGRMLSNMRMFCCFGAGLLMLLVMAHACAECGRKRCALAGVVRPHPRVRQLLGELGLLQHWNMFAPNAPRKTFRVAAIGVVALHGQKLCSPSSEKLGDACRIVHLWSEEGRPSVHLPVSDFWRTMRPPPVAGVDFATNRWRKLMENANASRGLGGFLCQQWRMHRKTERLLGLWVIRVQSEPPDARQVLHGAFKHWCEAASKTLMLSLPTPSWAT